VAEDELLRELGDDGVLLLTLNKPETMNALSGPISGALADAARESKRNDAIRAIVITGAGRGFCPAPTSAAAARPGRFEGGRAAPAKGRVARVNKFGPGDVIAALADADVPVIAALNGPAAGAGFGLALTCDVRIASIRRASAPYSSSGRGARLRHQLLATPHRRPGPRVRHHVPRRPLDAESALAIGLSPKSCPTTGSWMRRWPTPAPSPPGRPSPTPTHAEADAQPRQRPASPPRVRVGESDRASRHKDAREGFAAS
jgi:enoyl-CoA hydratase/carnithine racemase